MAHQSDDPYVPIDDDKLMAHHLSQSRAKVKDMMDNSGRGQPLIVRLALHHLSLGECYSYTVDYEVAKTETYQKMERDSLLEEVAHLGRSLRVVCDHIIHFDVMKARENIKDNDVHWFVDRTTDAMDELDALMFLATWVSDMLRQYDEMSSRDMVVDLFACIEDWRSRFGTLYSWQQEIFDYYRRKKETLPPAHYTPIVKPKEKTNDETG